MTPGRAALLAALSTSTRVGLARRLGVTPRAIGQWASGTRTPGYAARALLLAEIGIDLDAWDPPQNGTTVPPSGATLPPMKRRAIQIDSALDARIARLRSASAIAGAAPSTAALTAALVARGLEVTERELGLAEPTSPPPEDTWR